MKYSDFSTNLKYLQQLNNSLDGNNASRIYLENNGNNLDWVGAGTNWSGNWLGRQEETTNLVGEMPFNSDIPVFEKPEYDVSPKVTDGVIDGIAQGTSGKGNIGSKLSGINFVAGIEPTAALVGSMMNRNYKNPMKYAELDNYANQGNVDSFDALNNVYANLDKAPTASKRDFNGIDGKGWIDNWLKDTAAGASLGTSIAPGWGTLIGAVAGTANGLIRSGIQAGKSNKAYNDYLLAQEKANERLMANLNNSYHNAAMNEYNNLLSNMAAFGGKLNRFDMGGDISNGVNLIDSGSTHELNPYEGVQQGVDSQGIPNMVEEGEVVWEDEDYVFSNRLTVPKMPKKKSDDETKEEKFNRLYEGKTFAEVAERLQRESKERPNSGISKDTMNDNLSMLRDLQEEVKMKKQADEFKQEIANMSPEELMGLQQMLGAMGQQGMEQPIPEQMPEQLPQEGIMPQGMPDMGMAVNPAMMGQPMMACGGKLKKFGYGGNLFAFGGPGDITPLLINPDNPVENTPSSEIGMSINDFVKNYYPNANDLYINKSLSDRLRYRGDIYADVMNNAVNNSEYISALNYVGTPEAMQYWKDLVAGNKPYEKYSTEESWNDFETQSKIGDYVDNCITSTQTMDRRTHEELKKRLKEQRKDLEQFLMEKSNGVYSEEEIENYLDDFEKGIKERRSAITDSIPVETGIVKFQQKNKEGNVSIRDAEGNDSYYTLEIDDYTDKDMKENGKLYNLLKELPTGTTLGWGYNNKDTKTGFYSPAHYTMLYNNNGDLKVFNGNDSEFFKKALRGQASLDDTGKGAKFRTIDSYKGYNAKKVVKQSNEKGYTQNSEPLNENSRRLMIQIPILNGSNIDEYDELATMYASKHPDIGLKKVNWEKSEDGKEWKQGAIPIRVPSSKMTRIDMPPISTIPIDNSYYGTIRDTRPIDISISEINPYGKKRKKVAMNELAGKASDYLQLLSNISSSNDDVVKKFDDGGPFGEKLKKFIRSTYTGHGPFSPWHLGWTDAENWKDYGKEIQDIRETNKAIRDIKNDAKETGTYELDWSKVPNLIGSPYLPTSGVTKFDVTPKPKERKEHPWWGETWNNIKTAVGKGDMRLHAPEIANALGLAHEYLRDKSKDFAEELDFARHITEPNISYRPTGTMAPYRPESSLAVLDRLSAMNAASRNSLMNLSNASRAAKAMYNAMNDMKYFDALGQMDRQLREQNNTNYLKNLEFNNALAAQNAMGAYQAAATNAQLKNAQLASWSHIMDTLNQEALQRDTAKGLMATNFAELVSQHRKEEIQNKMLKEMAEKGSLLYYWDPRYQMNYSGNNTTALGGYIDVRPLDKRTKKNRK